MATIQKDYKKKVVSLQNEMRNMLLPIKACSDEKTKMKLYANFDLDSFERKLNELKDVFKLIKSTSQEKIYFNDFISKSELVIYSTQLTPEGYVRFGGPFLADMLFDMDFLYHL